MEICFGLVVLGLVIWGIDAMFGDHTPDDQARYEAHFMARNTGPYPDKMRLEDEQFLADQRAKWQKAHPEDTYCEDEGDDNTM